MKVYLSGPMTGLPGYNLRALDEAAAGLRLDYPEWTIVNPADLGSGGDWAEYLRADVRLVSGCDGIFMLRGWESSKGARLERHIAIELGLEVIYQPGASENGDETALDTAKRLVYGDRAQSYGHPKDDYDRTAALWTALLGHKLAASEHITADDAVRCMIAVKLSRDVHNAKRDNRVDIAGYAECLDRIETGK